MTSAKKEISYPDLGAVLYVKNCRAKHYIIRVAKGQVRVTLPYRGSFSQAESFLNEKREVVARQLKKAAEQELPHFNEAELRAKANALLPEKLAQLAKNHGFTYTKLTVRKSRTRWGSCSSRGLISLSLFLMILPEHLIEYVLLHELCHTVQPNHSPAFWSLLDRCVSGRAKALRQELKNYRIP
ncbi:MAG: M48 family metallopeptidase [Dysgonamonadaceae bacterium]|jgi:predicted metal-dependent hydrolase|nr:M48 family metallopeptidase [Dysgonamonadaceae bacterium]